MIKTTFIIDKEADVNIWYEYIRDYKDKDQYGNNLLKKVSLEILKKLENKEEKEQKQIISKHIEQYYTEENLNKFLTTSKNKIKANKEEIIKRLEHIHNKKIPVTKVIVKYETFVCCPYIYRGKESDWFGLYFAQYVIDKKIELSVFAHEVMHLFFHYYFDDYCLEKGLSEEQTSDLKEAVTVILNIDLKDIIEIEDNRYPDHQQLRKVIEEAWIKEKDFVKILDVGIEYLKKR
jgi:hypothetical protein